MAKWDESKHPRGKTSKASTPGSFTDKKSYSRMAGRFAEAHAISAAQTEELRRAGLKGWQGLMPRLQDEDRLLTGLDFAAKKANEAYSLFPNLMRASKVKMSKEAYSKPGLWLRPKAKW